MLITISSLFYNNPISDKVYRAVIAENQAQDAYKYHVVGGGAGTVSPSK